MSDFVPAFLDSNEVFGCHIDLWRDSKALSSRGASKNAVIRPRFGTTMLVSEPNAFGQPAANVVILVTGVVGNVLS